MKRGRRSKNVDSWIAEQDPSIRLLATRLRCLIWREEPEFKEAVRWSIPVYEKRGRVCYLVATDDYVTLGFFSRGIIKDNECPLGSRKGWGHSVNIHSIERINCDKVKGWIRRALIQDARCPI